MGKVLVTSAWPYLNVTPHLGNMIGSILSADVYARYCRLKGEEVIMVSGSDEHGTPIQVEAIRLGIHPRKLADKNHSKVVELWKKWGISFDNYTRTENPVHQKFVKEHLLKVYNNGFIIVQETEMLYCDHCGRFLPDRFVEGKCFYCGYEHARGDQCETCGRLLEPTTLVEPYCVICKNKPTLKKTKHWYFDMAKLSEQLTEYLNDNEQMSASTRNFSLNLVMEGLKPRAVTRDVSKSVEWGIPAPFPDSEGKTIYVWVEAVLGYVSATIEYFKQKGDTEKWKDFWLDKNARTLYFIGKDNILFHTVILPALLLASGTTYNLPWNVSATEFLQFEGQKASKSQRIGISIDEALELLPADYWRFFLIATRPETKDTDFSWDFFTEKINADLNDTFGNFIHRTLTFVGAQYGGQLPTPQNLSEDAKKTIKVVEDKIAEAARNFEECKLQAAANAVIGVSRIGNQYLNEKEPWNLLKKDREQAAEVLYVAMQIVKALAIISAPIVPFSAEEIWRTLNLEGSVHEQKWTDALPSLTTTHKIGSTKPLFRKIEESTQELDARLNIIRARSADSP